MNEKEALKLLTLLALMIAISFPDFHVRDLPSVEPMESYDSKVYHIKYIKDGKEI